MAMAFDPKTGKFTPIMIGGGKNQPLPSPGGRGGYSGRPVLRPVGRQKVLQRAIGQRQGPQGAQRLRTAPRTSQPQVQRGKRPGGTPAQALLRTGRPQRGGFSRPRQRQRRREPR